MLGYRTFEIREEGKLSNKLAVNHAMIPVGLTDDMRVYFREATKTGNKISVIDKGGEIRSIEFEYQSLLIYDDSCMIRFFRVNQKGEVVCLEAKDRKSTRLNSSHVRI